MARSAPSFRQWLIDRLLATVHVRVVLTDQTLERTAKMLGVQPDVLAEARVLFKERCQANSRQPPLGPKKAGTRHFQIKCRMPEPIYNGWKAYVEERGVDGSALLRSLIHDYLLGAEEPVLLRYWLWNGRRYSDVLDVGKTNRFRERALLTRGARRALELRAERNGCSATAIVRGLVLDVLRGKRQHVKLVDARTMYDDETKYAS